MAEIELNRLLNRPLDEEFLTADAGLDDSELISSQERFYRYLDTPRDFRIFRRFMAIEAIETSPELRAIASLTTAQERVLLSARRSSWLPDFGVQAGFTGQMVRAGAGSSPLSLPLGGALFSLPGPGRADWFIGFNATLPLFEGGAKAAERTRAQEELNRLGLERNATTERVEQRLQTSMHEMQASLLGIDLSRQAAAAAQSNLQLVTDTYRRGAATIIDLLDAQNASLVADEDARDLPAVPLDLITAVKTAIQGISINRIVIGVLMVFGALAIVVLLLITFVDPVP